MPVILDARLHMELGDLEAIKTPENSGGTAESGILEREGGDENDPHRRARTGRRTIFQMPSIGFSSVERLRFLSRAGDEFADREISSLTYWF